MAYSDLPKDLASSPVLPYFLFPMQDTLPVCMNE